MQNPVLDRSAMEAMVRKFMRGKHKDCPKSLKKAMAAVGVDITVSAIRPMKEGGPRPCKCPHGVNYWIAPTSSQITRWKGDDAP